MSRPYGVLYTSMLAPSAPASVVPAILASARINNQRNGLTGLLVFDGQNFCQYLEGPPVVVLERMERIRDDDRHTGIDIACKGETDARIFNRFTMGYAEPEANDLVGTIRTLSGAAALNKLVEMVPTLDLDG